MASLGCRGEQDHLGFLVSKKGNIDGAPDSGMLGVGVQRLTRSCQQQAVAQQAGVKATILVASS
jgi:hypothetical protein